VTLRLGTGHGRAESADRATVARLLEEGRFFWLDLEDPGPDEHRLLREEFGFHPLALEDAERFGQRPKVDPYGDVAFIVAYGAADDEDGLVEVHVFFSERFIVTVHRDRSDAVDALSAPPAQVAGAGAPIDALHRVLDALTDSFFPRLSAVDDRVDELQDEVVSRPSDALLQEVLTARRRLALLRRVVAGQRQLLAGIARGHVGLPGLTEEAQRYFRDVEDHLIRLNEQIDVDRDLLAGVTSLYLSVSSNRLNEVIKQLTVIATVFLPLTFVTGFFGQNFGWLVGSLDTMTDFLVAGVGGLATASLAIVLWFRARRIL
jgi:magnesium transporter